MANTFKVKVERTSAEIEASPILIDQLETIEGQLCRQASALVKKANDMIIAQDSPNDRFPPLLLQFRVGSRPFDNRLVWARYTPKKYNLRGTAKRFSKEVPGRRNGKYRSYIFNVFDEPLRSELIAIEKEATVLRRRMSFWGSVRREAKGILQGER
jgi:hypothetical protein